MKRIAQVLLIFCAPMIVFAQTRVETLNLNLPLQPASVSYSLPDAFPGLTFNRPVCLSSAPNDTDRLFVCERTGKIIVIPDVTSPSKITFLDLKAVVDARSGEAFDGSNSQGAEAGLLGLAFHPSFETNGHFFVVYDFFNSDGRFQRLSRFTVSTTNPNEALSNSEIVFIEQENEASNHNGGDIHFGEDGYLYMSWGDEGFANDSLNNSQTVTADFWSSIIRIDVDKLPGNVEPQPHPAIPLTVAGGFANYSVPSDNPAFTNGSLDASRLDRNQVRTEFWAIGLRNPWRMSFDEMTGKLICADVGQGAREEVSVIEKGGNYQWAFREGEIVGPKSGQQKPFGWEQESPPVITYNRTEGRSITGGRVYYGSNIPELVGKYVYADYVTGNIWISGTSFSSPPLKILTEIGISAFGEDPSNKDLLLCDLDNGIIRRLQGVSNLDQFPATLSQTGVFTDLGNLTPEAGVLPYDVNLTFWSDHALKQRWFAVGNVNSKIDFQEEGPWAMPEGSVWIKHFDLELVRGDPTTAKRLETRIIVRTASGIEGVSYRWNEAGTDADLVPAVGVSFPVQINDNGNLITQTWEIPAQADCATCHNPEAGHLLSFNTRQLNRADEIGGVSGNYIQLLENAGYFSNDIPETLNLPKHVRWDDPNSTFESQVRSYLDVNCSYCHADGGSNEGAFSAKAFLSLSDTRMVEGFPNGNRLNDADRLLVPGNVDRSVIWSRIAEANGYSRMPPLASNVIDEVGRDKIRDWILQDLPNRQTYPQWRLQQFGNGFSFDGEPTTDFDSDGLTNLEEFLLKLPPAAPSVAPSPLIQMSNASSITIDYPEFTDRRTVIETSDDLIQWDLWGVTGNTPDAPTSDMMQSLTGSAPDAHKFFRMSVREN